MTNKNLGESDVALSFELDSNGIAEIAKAEATLEEEVELKELTIEMTTAQEYAFSTPELADGWSTGKPQMTDEERSDVVVKIDELKAWLTEWEASQKAAVTGLHTSGYV
ncbi:hypothetical protein PI124_g10879 [Phytophthora idaei]|nr:hypothetical protein PI124_g10879 [Phytophthora idaei]